MALYVLKGAMQHDSSIDVSAYFILCHLQFQCINTICVEVVTLIIQVCFCILLQKMTNEILEQRINV